MKLKGTLKAKVPPFPLKIAYIYIIYEFISLNMVLL